MTTPFDSAGAGRWRHALGHLRYAAWLAFHPRAPLPEGPLGIPVRTQTHSARMLELQDIAERLGVTRAERDGVMIAERWFGPLRVLACLVTEARTQSLPVLLDSEMVTAVSAWASGDVPGSAS